MRELNAFRDWTMVNRPSTGQVVLWYTLMTINNMIGWKEWFPAPNPTLQLMTGLSRQGLDKARNSLIQLGLIQYKKGSCNKSGSYHMISFGSFGYQKVGKEVGKGVDKEVDRSGALSLLTGQRLGSTYIYKQNKKKQKENINVDNSLTDRNQKTIKQISNLFIQRSNRIPGKEDVNYMANLLTDRIPLNLILDGIHYAFDQYKPKFKGDSITSFAYCDKVIRRKWSDHERRGPGYANSSQECGANRRKNSSDSITGDKVGWVHPPKWGNKLDKTRENLI
jgi:hypothetical protein